MSISYPNVPGIEVSIQDGGLILPEDGTTESLLVIAPSTAAEVPTDPILVRQSSDAVTYFGSFTDKNGVVNPITAAWKAAFEGGNRRTYLLAVNGEGADAAAKTKSAFLEMHNLFFGILADFTIDNIAVRDYFADVETSVLVAGDFPNPEDAANFPNVGGVLKYGYKVAGDALSYPVTIATGTTDSFVINIGTDKTVTIGPKVYDGTSGKTFADLATDIKEDLTAAVGLENFNVLVEENKLVILGDIPFSYKVGTAGDATAVLKMTANTAGVKTRHENGTLYVGNFAELMKDYCEDQTINHNTVKGFIGVSAPVSSSLTDIKAHIDAVVALNNEYSGHLSVSASPELAYSIPGKSGTYYANGAVTYAALVSTLSAQSAPTNKAVSGVTGMAYNLSLRQLNSLSGNKYVSFRYKNGGIYVTDGITTAPDIVIGNQVNKSDYTRLSTLRITHAAINMIRQVSEPFIGEPSGVPQKNALNSALSSGFIGMRSAGAISDYAFSIIQTGSQIGQTKITVQLVPAFENTKISVDVSLRPLLN